MRFVVRTIRERVGVTCLTTEAKLFTAMPTRNFGMRLEPHEHRLIERLARARGTNMKDAILGAVQRQLEELNTLFHAKPGAVLEGLEDGVGSAEGPEDLSTNKEYRSGYGR